MYFYREFIGRYFSWLMTIWVVLQALVLFYSGLGLFSFWMFIEYLQLISYIPLLNLRLLPYLYDAFRPFLLSHGILFNYWPLEDELNFNYLNKNCEYYKLSVSDLFQSIYVWFAVLVCIAVVNILFWLCKCCKGKQEEGQVSQRIT